MSGYKIIIIIVVMLTLVSMMFGLFGWFGGKEGDTAPYEKQIGQLNGNTIYQFTMNDIDGKPVNLSEYKDQVVVIVNVASKCGYTPQYESLQRFYESFKDKGVVVLAFPANNFLGQEPGSDAEIKEFCQKNYGVTFPVFSKISVKGKGKAPLYRFLTEKEENGIMDSSVKWNFQKYVIDRKGKLVTYFDPGTKVDDEKFLEVINKLL